MAKRPPLTTAERLVCRKLYLEGHELDAIVARTGHPRLVCHRALISTHAYELRGGPRATDPT